LCTPDCRHHICYGLWDSGIDLAATEYRSDRRCALWSKVTADWPDDSSRHAAILDVLIDELEDTCTCR